jgi:hypothetical protein
MYLLVLTMLCAAIAITRLYPSYTIQITARLIVFIAESLRFSLVRMYSNK